MAKGVLHVDDEKCRFGGIEEIQAHGSSSLSINPEDAGARPILERHLVDDYVQAVGLGLGVLDHGVGNRLGQLALLIDPSAPATFRQSQRAWLNLLYGARSLLDDCTIAPLYQRAPAHWPTVAAKPVTKSLPARSSPRTSQMGRRAKLMSGAF